MQPLDVATRRALLVVLGVGMLPEDSHHALCDVIYIYIYTCIYVCVHMYIYAYVHIYVYILPCPQALMQPLGVATPRALLVEIHQKELYIHTSV